MEIRYWTHFILSWKTGNHCHMIAKHLVKPKNGGHVTKKDIALETLVREIQWVRLLYGLH